MTGAGWSGPALDRAAVRAGTLEGPAGELAVTGLVELAKRGEALDRLGYRATGDAAAYAFAGLASPPARALDGLGAKTPAGILARLDARNREALAAADAAAQVRDDWAAVAEVAQIVGEKAFRLALMLLLAA